MIEEELRREIDRLAGEVARWHRHNEEVVKMERATVERAEDAERQRAALRAVVLEGITRHAAQEPRMELAGRAKAIAGDSDSHGSCKHDFGVGAACYSCILALVQREVAAERERCAKVADRFIEDSTGPVDTGRLWRSGQARVIATAIRAEEPRDG